jgi:uncharacterized protein (DUF4415 family)
VDLLPDKLETKNMKFRVTMMVDLDVLDALRAEAAKNRKGYQTLINDVLRQHVFGNEVNARLASLEKAVFKKAM